MANTIPAVYGLNKFLWNYLTNTAGILQPGDYDNLTPIIPNGEEPQFLNVLNELGGIQSRPYIVYTWYTNGFDCDSWYKPTDTVLYTVYAMDQTTLNKIVVSTVDLFKRYDVSAAELNSFIRANNFGNLNDQYQAYNYGYTYVAAATGGVAPDIENDPITATITLRVNYTKIDRSLDYPLA